MSDPLHIDKKVDEDWKEQIWREREKARQAEAGAERTQAAGPQPGAGRAGAPPPGGGARPTAAGPPPGADRGEPAPEEGSAESQLFESFLQSLAMQASMFLGAMADPRSGIVSEDLGQARYLIDVLGMLERKMRGNLTPREAQLLQLLLQDLRMAYVARVQAQAAGGPGAGGPGRPQGGPAGPPF